MPVRRKVARKPKRKVAPRRKARVPRGINDAGQMATIKETVAFTDLDPNLGYNFNFNLSQFRRASQLAPNFKWYKPLSVEWTIEPLYNTFQDGTTGTEVTVPYMYMTMNRTQDQTGIALADIQAMGAKPQKLVGKKTIKYKPNWCSPGLNTYANQVFNTPTGTATAIIRLTNLGLKAQYSYVACPDTVSATNLQNVPSYIVPTSPPGFGQDGTNAVNANQVIFNGHTIWIDQEVPTGTLQPVARVVATVTWHFKDPHCTYLIDPESYKTVVPELPPASSPAPTVL
jgi:hypothetical protein